VNRFLREHDVILLSTCLDGVPMAYTNIRDMMAARKDLATILG
jgi:hypothetical protein